MAIYQLDDLTPAIHETAFVHPDAVVIGDVTIGAESTVWPMAVLRGDYGTNAVVPNQLKVHPGALALGVPAKVLEGRSNAEMIRFSAEQYVRNGARFRQGLRRLD